EYNWQALNPEVPLVDPPRSGLHDKLIEQIRRNPPKEILYVSCNYKALARELALFADLYEVQSMKAIDMFPQTPHVEVVTHLQHR
ncbi:MAG: hypothetical protein KDD60_04395, partial [Bdellovibrionales bacterium]|nr:hypothetical protein [Bdellovibrionales bacterium]